jgi:hypothetical protein
MITMSPVTDLPGVARGAGIRAVDTGGGVTDLPGVTLPSTMSRVTVMPRAVVLIVVGSLAFLKAVDSMRVATAGRAPRMVCVGHRVTSSGLLVMG